MNDYVIRFTPKTDDNDFFSYERLVEAVQEMMNNGSEWTGPSGWKVLQHGEFNDMQKSMTAERGFINVTFEKLGLKEEEQRKRDREKLKDVFISPEAMEELRNWRVEEIDNGKVIDGLVQLEKSDIVPDLLTPPIPQCLKNQEGMRKLKEFNNKVGIADCKNWLPSQEQADALFLNNQTLEDIKKWGTDKNPAIGEDGKLDLDATVLTDRPFGVSVNYTFNPDEDFTESVTMEPEGKRWVSQTTEELGPNLNNQDAFSNDDLWKGGCSGTMPKTPEITVLLENLKFQPTLDSILQRIRNTK